MKKLLISLLILSLLLTGCSTAKGAFESEDKLHVVSTIYVGYDIAKSVGAENVEAKLLLKPGSESHTFEPTPKDIIAIEESDVFICTGGENDAWVETILGGIENSDLKIIRMTECVSKLFEEELVEGMQEEEEEEEEETEWDEHVWMDADNAVAICNAIRDAFTALDGAHADAYRSGAEAFAEAIMAIDEQTKNAVASAARHEVIFADRFPARYYTERYGLDYYAAFPGCSENTEASASTVSFLIDRTREDGIPAVFVIELSAGKLGSAIAEETGAKVLTFYTGHNVSAADFDRNLSFIDMMQMNCEALTEALN